MAGGWGGDWRPERKEAGTQVPSTAGSRGDPARTSSASQRRHLASAQYPISSGWKQKPHVKTCLDYERKQEKGNAENTEIFTSFQVRQSGFRPADKRVAGQPAVAREFAYGLTCYVLVFLTSVLCFLCKSPHSAELGTFVNPRGFFSTVFTEINSKPFKDISAQIVFLFGVAPSRWRFLEKGCPQQCLHPLLTSRAPPEPEEGQARPDVRSGPCSTGPAKPGRFCLTICQVGRWRAADKLLLFSPWPSLLVSGAGLFL